MKFMPEFDTARGTGTAVMTAPNTLMRQVTHRRVSLMQGTGVPESLEEGEAAAESTEPWGSQTNPRNAQGNSSTTGGSV